MEHIWWYEIHCPDCGVLKRDRGSKRCPDCGNEQAICLPPERFSQQEEEDEV